MTAQTHKLSPSRVRLFHNSWLEAATHVPVWLPALVWLPVISWLLIKTAFAPAQTGLSAAEWIVLPLASLVFWTFSEYFLHRFAFHARPAKPVLKRMVFLVHGVHHDYPTDATRLLMPPVAAIPLAFLFGLLFEVALGQRLATPFLAFFLCGYLIYDYIHYSTHHLHSRHTLFRAVKKSHMRHHYVSPDSRYGVSSPLWDWVFGTLGAKDDAPTYDSRAENRQISR